MRKAVITKRGVQYRACQDDIFVDLECLLTTIMLIIFNVRWLMDKIIRQIRLIFKP
jgi:hypothetical protein